MRFGAAQCPRQRETRKLAQQRTIRINRAPLLTLWAAVVAERLGFDYDTALSLGRAVAGLNAYSKGVSLRLFEPSSEAVDERLQKAKAGTTLRVDLLHRAVPVMATPDGLRAFSKDRPISPARVEHHLGNNFGDNLGSAMRAMVKARAVDADRGNRRAGVPPLRRVSAGHSGGRHRLGCGGRA